MNKISPENAKSVSEAIKNLVIAVSILVGGGWALYTFNAKLEVENAKAKLEKLNRELEENTVILIDLSAAVVARTDDSWAYLETSVVICNQGNQETRILFDFEPFMASKIGFKDGVIDKYDPMYYSYPYFPPIKASDDTREIVKSLTILPGQTKELSTTFKVSSPGFYQVSFISVASHEISNARNNVGDKIKDDDINKQGLGKSSFIYIDHNKANALGRQKAPLVPRSTFCHR